MSVDLVIRNGTVYDGTGAEGVRVDVAVANGRATGSNSHKIFGGAQTGAIQSAA